MAKPNGGGAFHFKRAVRWPIILAACGALFLIVGVSTVRETYREWKVDQEISNMQAQVEALEGKKLKLTDLIQRLNSSDAIDEEARTRLGLRKPGERVIILRGADGETNSWQDSLDFHNTSTQSVSRSNPQKWVSYFFRLNEAL